MAGYNITISYACLPAYSLLLLLISFFIHDVIHDDASLHDVFLLGKARGIAFTHEKDCEIKITSRLS